MIRPGRGGIGTCLSPGLSPGSRAFEAETRVKRHMTVNSAYRLIVLEAPQSILQCQAGQFFHILCPVTADHQPYLRRPMSIYGYSTQTGELQFLYKLAGEGTRALAGLEVGQTLNLLGPLGVGFTIKPNWQHLLLLARGVGLATLAPLAQEAQRRHCKLVAICSARHPELLMSTDHFRSLGAEVITVTDAEGTSDPENLRMIIEGYIAAGLVDVTYTCGSNRMLKLLREIGAKHAIPGEVALRLRGQFTKCPISSSAQVSVEPSERTMISPSRGSTVAFSMTFTR